MREPKEDVAKCADASLEWLKKRPGVYVTPGWVWDRGVGYTEHTISMALKLLVRAHRADCRAAYGIPTYAWVTNLDEVIADREREKAKRKKHHAGS